ncbi:MAG: DsbA family protein [candidate division WOR-3 bacterium]
MKRNYIILLGLVIGILISLLAFFYSSKSTSKSVIEYSVYIKGAVDPTLGKEDAKTIIIEYFDFTCPHCAHFHLEKLPKLYKNYIENGKVKFISKSFLLRPQSLYPALASRCAYEQNKYWEYSHKLFDEFLRSGPFAYNRANFIRIAYELKLDTLEFIKCFDSQKYKDIILRNVEEGLKDSIRATPTFIINGQKIEGDLPYEKFVKFIK